MGKYSVLVFSKTLENIKQYPSSSYTFNAIFTIFSTGNSNSSLSAQSASYYRAMSHYMQTDPNSASIYQYHPLYSAGNPASLTTGTNSSTGTTGGGTMIQL